MRLLRHAEMQVRNLRPCIKMAVDYVTPEGLADCLDIAAEKRKYVLKENAVAKSNKRRLEAPAERLHQDKLQVMGHALFC